MLPNPKSFVTLLVMTNLKDYPPALKAVSRCTNSLDFEPQRHWPPELPGIAVNGLVIAGFKQKLVLDHQIPISDTSRIAELFISLHPDISVLEQARLWSRLNQDKKLSWFPIEKILSTYRFLQASVSMMNASLN